MNFNPRSSTGAQAASKRSHRHEPDLCTIGDLAKEFGVSLRTIRFYEDRGLLSPQRDGTARFYDSDQRARLTLILKGKQLGFTLGEIRDLIRKEGRTASPGDLSLNPDQITLQISHLERQRTEIDVAIIELRETYNRLVQSDQTIS